MTIDPGTDQPWGAGEDELGDEPSEGAEQAGADPSAQGHRDDTQDGDKLPWGDDEERYGHDGPDDGGLNLDPDPADPPRISGLDIGDDGRAED